MPYRLSDVGYGVGENKVDRDQSDSGYNDIAKNSYLEVECVFKLSLENEIIGAEIDRKDQHKYGDYYLNVGRKGCKAIVLYSESSGACGRKCGSKSLKNTKTAKEQKNKLNEREKKIYHVKDKRGGFHFGNKLRNLRTGALRLHDMKVSASAEGDKRHNENENSHSADPVCERAPHKKRLG